MRAYKSFYTGMEALERDVGLQMMRDKKLETSI